MRIRTLFFIGLSAYIALILLLCSCSAKASLIVEEPGEVSLHGDITGRLEIRVPDVIVYGNGYTVNGTGSTALQIGTASAHVDNVLIRDLGVVGSSTANDLQLAWIINAQNVMLEGCTIDLRGGNGYEVLQTQYSVNLTFRDCVFLSDGRNKLSLRSESRNFTFERCRIEVGGTGVQVTSGGGHLFKHCEITAGEVGVYYRTGAEPCEIINSLIVAPTTVSFFRYEHVGAFDVYNSTLIGDLAALSTGLESKIFLANCISTGKRIGKSRYYEWQNTWFEITDGPVGFLDGTYIPGASSAAIDAGNPAWVLWPDDLNGNPREVGIVDLGAYEHQGGYVPPDPPDPPIEPPIPPIEPPDSIDCPTDTLDMRIIWDNGVWTLVQTT